MNANVFTYPELAAFSGALTHGFIARVEEIDVATDRETALARLETVHRRALDAVGLRGRPLRVVRQVHGTTVAVLDDPRRDWASVEADALITDCRDIIIGIYVADCCPVFLVDNRGRAAGLVHSGRKGTERGVVPAAIQRLCRVYGVAPADLVALLGPCIRPPHYEVDFAAQIAGQCREAGVGTVADCGENTGADTERYYSYRMEKGRTGRMLAFLGLLGQNFVSAKGGPGVRDFKSC